MEVHLNADCWPKLSRKLPFLAEAVAVFALLWCTLETGVAASTSSDARGTWLPAGNMARGYGSAAVLLPDGKVLLAGRAGYSTTTNSQIYDPGTDTWALTAPLNHARSGDTLTLLPDGRVLATGGFDGKHSLSSAELFDPASRTWTNTDSMRFARYKHTATLLPNGKVLVAGDYSGTNDFLYSVLYDSGESGKQSETRSRVQMHTPLLNETGSVPTAGALANDSASAELYDPATGKWDRTGSLIHARGACTATLLTNGLVLLAGGFAPQGAVLSSAELYTPASGTWTEVGALQVARANHTATLLPNGKVLVVGGQDGNGAYLREAELFDPLTQKWTLTSPMLFERLHHTATLLQTGKVLVAGGHAITGATAVTELYDFTTETWSRAMMMKTARFWHTATLLHKGKVLVAGGAGAGPNDSLSSTELFDPCPPSK